MINGKKIAILIDGDNAESALIEQYISEAGRFGKVTVKRIYADWTDNRMKGWKEQLNKFAVRPMQKFAYTTAKNSTDTALIIDAMDLLHDKLVEGICIVSSDSDYTGLAHRIREEGLIIVGIGKSKTPEAFTKACEFFTYSENLKQNKEKNKEKQQEKEKKKKKKEQKQQEKEEKEKVAASKVVESKVVKKIDTLPINPMKKSGVESLGSEKIQEAFKIAVRGQNGLASLSAFGQALRVVEPTFNHKNFGYGSFSKFCEALAPDYQVILDKNGQNFLLKKNN